MAVTIFSAINGFKATCIQTFDFHNFNDSDFLASENWTLKNQEANGAIVGTPLDKTPLDETQIDETPLDKTTHNETPGCPHGSITFQQISPEDILLTPKCTEIIKEILENVA